MLVSESRRAQVDPIYVYFDSSPVNLIVAGADAWGQRLTMMAAHPEMSLRGLAKVVPLSSDKG